MPKRTLLLEPIPKLDTIFGITFVLDRKERDGVGKS